MWHAVESLRAVLAGRARKALPLAGGIEAAVLVPIFPGPDGAPQLVLTRRADTLRHHTGEMCFPGGLREAADPDLLATALREAHEEIALDPARVAVLGALDDILTYRGARITPYVGVVPADYPFAPDPAEVAEVVKLPLADFARPDFLRVEERLYPDGVRRPVYFFQMGPYLVWGATARIIKEGLSAVGPAIGAFVDKPGSEA